MTPTKVASIKEIHEAYEGIPDRVRKRLQDVGLSPLERPTEQGLTPKLPDDLAVVAPPELGRLLTEFTAFADWVASKVADADLERSNRRSLRDAIWAKLRFKKAGDPADRADQARIDPEFLKADQATKEAECYHNMLECIAKAYNRDIRVVSREIARRQSEFDRHNSESMAHRSFPVRPMRQLPPPLAESEPRRRDRTDA
jgi:hypothetical protein